MLDALEYDCNGYFLTSTEEGTRCLNRTSNLRNTMAALVRVRFDYILHMLENFLEGTNEKAASKTEKSTTCRHRASFKPGVFEFIKAINKTRRGMLIRVLERNLRVTERRSHLVKELDMLISGGDNHSQEDAYRKSEIVSRCKEEYSTLLPASRAALFVLSKQLEPDYTFSLGNLLINTNRNTILHKSTNETKVLLDPLRDVNGQLIKQSKLSHQDVLQYILGTDKVSREKLLSSSFKDCLSASGQMNDAACKNLTLEMNSHYKEVVKVMKYTLQPLSREISSQSDYEDYERGITKLSKLFPLKDKQNLYKTFRPLLLGCKFGTTIRKLEADCSMLKRTFSTKGISYVFNSDSVKEIFKDSPWTKSFYREMEEVKKDISNGKRNTSSGIFFPKSNGPRFSLDLLLQVPTNGKSLSIQESQNVPDLAGQQFRVLPGTHTLIQVTPTIIHSTPELVTGFSPDKRNCLDKTEISRGSVFKQYSNANCVFECNLVLATSKCGCVPWDFPRQDGTTPMCAPKGSTCFRQAISAMETERCGHCIPDCNTVHYSHKEKVVTMRRDDLYGACVGHGARRNESLSRTVRAAFSQHFSRELGMSWNRRDLTQTVSAGSSQMFCMEFARSAMARVSVFVEPPLATRITQQPRVTFAGQLANLGNFIKTCEYLRRLFLCCLGGVVALFTGMSLLSIFELIMWVLHCPVFSPRRKNGPDLPPKNKTMKV